MLKSTRIKSAMFLVLTITYLQGKKHKHPALNWKLWDMGLRHSLQSNSKTTWVWLDYDTRIQIQNNSEKCDHDQIYFRSNYLFFLFLKQTFEYHIFEINIWKINNWGKKQLLSHVMLTWTYVLESGIWKLSSHPVTVPWSHVIRGPWRLWHTFPSTDAKAPL